MSSCIQSLYLFLHNRSGNPAERHEYSSGQWEDTVRCAAVQRCQRMQGIILEVGCGEGLLLSKLADEKGAHAVCGVDLHHERLTRAYQRTRGTVSLIQGDCAHLPFPNNYFDGVICVNALLNLPRAHTVADALTEMSRVVKRGGSVVFDFRNRRNPLIRLKYRYAHRYDPTIRNISLRSYDEATMRTMAQQAHLRVVSIQYLAFPRNQFSPLVFMETKKW